MLLYVHWGDLANSDHDESLSQRTFLVIHIKFKVEFGEVFYHRIISLKINYGVIFFLVFLKKVL